MVVAGEVVARREDANAVVAVAMVGCEVRLPGRGEAGGETAARTSMHGRERDGGPCARQEGSGSVWLDE